MRYLYWIACLVLCPALLWADARVQTYLIDYATGNGLVHTCYVTKDQFVIVKARFPGRTPIGAELQVNGSETVRAGSADHDYAFFVLPPFSQSSLEATYDLRIRAHRDSTWGGVVGKITIIAPPRSYGALSGASRDDVIRTEVVAASGALATVPIDGFRDQDAVGESGRLDRVRIPEGMPVSGMIVTSDGLIITVDHGLRDATIARFRYRGELYQAIREPVSADLAVLQQETDLCLWRAKSTPKAGFLTVSMAATSDPLVHSEPLGILGYSGQRRGSASWISGDFSKIQDYDTQAESRIPPYHVSSGLWIELAPGTQPDRIMGMSGGPVAEFSGKVVGVQNYVEAENGAVVAHAIPVSTIRHLLDLAYPNWEGKRKLLGTNIVGGEQIVESLTSMVSGSPASAVPLLGSIMMKSVTPDIRDTALTIADALPVDASPALYELIRKNLVTKNPDVSPADLSHLIACVRKFGLLPRDISMKLLDEAMPHSLISAGISSLSDLYSIDDLTQTEYHRLLALCSDYALCNLAYSCLFRLYDREAVRKTSDVDPQTDLQSLLFAADPVIRKLAVMEWKTAKRVWNLHQLLNDYEFALHTKDGLHKIARWKAIFPGSVVDDETIKLRIIENVGWIGTTQAITILNDVLESKDEKLISDAMRAAAARAQLSNGDMGDSLLGPKLAMKRTKNIIRQAMVQAFVDQLTDSRLTILQQAIGAKAVPVEMVLLALGKVEALTPLQSQLYENINKTNSILLVDRPLLNGDLAINVENLVAEYHSGLSSSSAPMLASRLRRLSDLAKVSKLTGYWTTMEVRQLYLLATSKDSVVLNSLIENTKGPWLLQVDRDLIGIRARTAVSKYALGEACVKKENRYGRPVDLN